MSTLIRSLDAIQLLKNQIKEGQALLTARPLSKNRHEQWVIITESYLRKIFGEDSKEDEAVFDRRGARSFPMNADEEWWERYRVNELERQISALEAHVKILYAYVAFESDGTIISTTAPGGHRIFIVHGHDNAVKFDVARFLDGLGLESIILHEKPNQGRTIIEKFEEYSDVGFAVVLLTADDQGGPINSSNLQLRARQNVILELGYFLGKLGRKRVCALIDTGIDIPSDFSGVIYIPIDPEEGWKAKLAKELREAGYSVDLNKA